MRNYNLYIGEQYPVPEGWKRLNEQLMQLYLALVLLSDECGVNQEFDKDRQRFVTLLENKFPDCETYMAFHKIIGSTSPYETTPNMDFPGEYSVLLFFKTWEQKLRKLKEKSEHVE